ncbi:PAS domain S-box protein [Methylobacterium sp. 17Sr1-1]|uniref:PAS domain S-box protein n=1 Tax=Methylobacterium sp. 17Sr1-1 TaxID=2202826 RepID=UPI000D6F39DF|nr:PAS domain S-box protein [Methylobacterium sp. 17Sr1-1]AWN51090.1 histidine kinase [Methylobacterium sp. 17Sr1-1]
MDERTIIADLERRLAAAEAALSEEIALRRSEELRRTTVEGGPTRSVDTTEQQRAKDALRDSEARHRELFERMAEGFAELEAVRDDEGNLTDFRHLARNPASTRVTGLRDEQVLGRLVGEVLPPKDARFWIDAYSQVFVSGQPSHFENFIPNLDRWFGINVTPFGRNGVGVFYEDITDRKRSELAARENEERQAFLLKLSDTFRKQMDAASLISAAARLLGEKMDASRIMFAEFDVGRGVAEIFFGWFADGAEPFPTTMSLDEYKGSIVDDLLAGRTVRINDTGSPFDRPDLAAIAEIGVKALLSVPVVAPGRRVVNLSVHQHTARHWTDDDVALVNEVIQRLWSDLQRMRSEGALQASEERFRQFANASAAGLWMRKTDTLVMEFTSPAIATIYGVEADALLGEVARWAAMIVPDDREAALGRLAEACCGETVVHEFRIQRPSDGAFRWIRNVDFPLRDNGHILRIGGIAQDVTEAKLAVEHQAVLLAELQHRVRNIMALLRSITARTGESAQSASEYRDMMMGRLLAFARVQALLTRAANVNVGIASLVHDEVNVQAQHEGQYVLDGPNVTLSPKAAEVLTLAVHELATNALKYGALSVPTGRVTVRWSTFEKRGGTWLAFDWTEEGAPVRAQPTPDTPRHRGFGSELIEARIPYELRGRGQVTIEPGGARCHLEFPLQEGASILETGAPQRASVFGGAIDMTGEPDLTGRRVLVVEDDYYLATDAARALRGAGAEVLGPCATEADARAELVEQRPDAVVVDINLGPGPSFKLAEALKDRGIPFVFTTGYDAEVIPAEFAEVERLEKPLQLRQIVGAIAKLTTAA